MESSKFNYNDQPFLVKFSMVISTIGCIYHDFQEENNTDDE